LRREARDIGASDERRGIAVKISAAVMASAVALSLASHANAEAADSKIAGATPGEVRILATAAIREPLNAVLKKAEAAIGKPIVVEYGSARGNLKDEILKSREFDAPLLLPDVDDEIEAAGIIAPGRFEIARVPVAFGLRGDVPSPDVSSPAAMKAAMLNAKSVKYAPMGAALMTVKNILSAFGMAGTIHDSSTLQAEVPLAAGEYEIDIYPVSEIISNKKLKNLGAVIPELRVPVIIEATVAKQTLDPKAVRALIAFLQGTAIDQALTESGMEKARLGK
jgi:molybdate transport system substrate-binding protein